MRRSALTVDWYRAVQRGEDMRAFTGRRSRLPERSQIGRRQRVG